jgi:hypothetical protein
MESFLTLAANRCSHSQMGLNSQRKFQVEKEGGLSSQSPFFVAAVSHELHNAKPSRPPVQVSGHYTGTFSNFKRSGSEWQRSLPLSPLPNNPGLSPYFPYASA